MSLLYPAQHKTTSLLPKHQNTRPLQPFPKIPKQPNTPTPTYAYTHTHQVSRVSARSQNISCQRIVRPQGIWKPGKATANINDRASTQRGKRKEMEENRPSKRIKTTDAMSTSRPYGFVSESLLYSNMGLSSEAIAFLGSPRVSSTLRIRAGMISNACYITSGDTIREFRRFIALKGLWRRLWWCQA